MWKVLLWRFFQQLRIRSLPVCLTVACSETENILYDCSISHTCRLKIKDLAKVHETRGHGTRPIENQNLGTCWNTACDRMPVPKSKESSGKKLPSPSGLTKLMAPSDYEHVFHQAPSEEVKQAGRKIAQGLIQPSAMERSNDPLAVTEYEKLPPLVEEEMRTFLKSQPRVYRIPEKK